jgi:hypothetical protein
LNALPLMDWVDVYRGKSVVNYDLYHGIQLVLAKTLR